MCVVVDVRSERQGGGEGTFGTTILCPVAIAPVADVIFSPTTTDPTAVADRCNTERGTASSFAPPPPTLVPILVPLLFKEELSMNRC